jgi:hypothetical protein
MNLFRDEVPDLVKEAAFASRVSEQPENWPMEINSELFKQLPFLSDYDVNVNLDRVDPGRGFAFGYADVSNKTERPEIEHEEMGIPHIRIPVIIMERSVKPFSVFLDGEKVMPLSEERIRETLFNPTTFDLSTALPRDPSLVEPLMPPQRSGIGMGGEYKMASALSPVEQAFLEAMEKKSDPKEFAKRMRERKGEEKWGGSEKIGGSLLLVIAPTMRESDRSAFIEKLSSDAAVIAGFRRNQLGARLADIFDNVKTASAEDRLAVIAESIEPTVVTIQKLPGHQFLVKSASNEAFAPGQAAKGEVIPEAEAAESIGAENAQKMQPGQTATVVNNPVGNIEQEESKAKVVEEYGQYKVEDALGNSLLGHVFPTTLAWDGLFTPQQTALFTNGSAYAFQDSVAGDLVGKGTNLPSDEPRGDGCFYCVEGGDAIATQPLTIGSAVAGPDGNARFSASDVFGNPIVISQTEGLKEPMRLDGNEFAIPDSWKFMRLNNQTQVASAPGAMSKVPEARAKQAQVDLFYNGSFNLRGGCGLDKLSRDFRYDLDPVTAEFMLGVLGVDGVTAKLKVAEARKVGHVKLSNLKSITLLGERLEHAQKTAAALVERLPDLRKDLVKEAAALDDADTVDKILALNFINPENLETFINYIPDLEKTAENLAEMLLFSYLGMNELPEGPIDRCMRSLDEVITGLKGIAGSEV